MKVEVCDASEWSGCDSSRMAAEEALSTLLGLRKLVDATFVLHGDTGHPNIDVE